MLVEDGAQAVARLSEKLETIFCSQIEKMSNQHEDADATPSDDSKSAVIVTDIDSLRIQAKEVEEKIGHEDGGNDATT